MGKFGSFLSVSLLLTISFFGRPAAEIVIERNEAITEFPQKIDFHLAASGPNTIETVELEFGNDGLSCGQTVNRAVPEDYEPSADIEVEWTWNLRQSGSMPPGTKIWWHWVLTDSEGQITETPQQEIIFTNPDIEKKSLESEHLTLYWQEGSQTFAQDLLDAGEHALDDLEWLASVLDGPSIKVYILPSASDMQSVTLFAPDWSGGRAFPSFRNVLIGVAPSELAWGKTTMAHELTHVVVGMYTFSCVGGAPTWVDEGLAMVTEGELEPNYVELLNKAIEENTLLAIRELGGGFSNDPELARQSYAQSYSLIDYLLEAYGTDAMLMLLEAFKDGSSEDTALQQVYGFNRDGLEIEWRATVGATPMEISPEMEATPTRTPWPTIAPITGPEVQTTPTLVSEANPNSTPTVEIQPTNPPPIQIDGPRQSLSPILIIGFGGGCIAIVLVIGTAIFFIRRRESGRQNRDFRRFPTLTLNLMNLRIRKETKNMLKKGKIKKVGLLGLLVVGLVLSGCNPKDTPQSPTETPVPASETAPLPTETPLPTPTAIPPARPLAESEAVAGVYRNDTLGVAEAYDDNWEVIFEDESELERLFLVDRSFGLLYVLLSAPRSEGETTDEFVAGFTEIWPQLFGFEVINWSSDPDETALNDGTPALFVTGEGTGGTWDTQVIRYDLVFVERGGMAFITAVLAETSIFDTFEEDLLAVAYALEVYPPQPYGVSRENALFLPASEPLSYDPAKWVSNAGGMVGDLFSGLVRLDTNLQPIPDLAESWEISPDGTVYTFHLRQNAFFHNGRPVTADDVKFSWDRAVNPETESITAKTYLGDVVGVQEVVDGSTTEISGVQVLDDYTLEVTLDAPKVYFLSKLSYPISWIVDRDTLDEIDEHPVGTGPFKVLQHDEDEVLILGRNETYHLGFVPLEYIVFLMDPGPTQRLYEAGEIDIVGIDEDLLERAEDPSDPLFGDIYPSNSLCTTLVRYDVSQPPFEDPLVRKAFTLAVDKDRYNEVINEGRGVVAQGLFPPGLPGYNPDIQGLAFDIDAAQQALADSTYGSAGALPEITFTTSGAGSGIPTTVALFIEMWEETFGIKINIEQIDYESYLDEIHAGNHGQLLQGGWCADYPDPENFADILFHSAGEQNTSNYNNPEIDALLEQARSIQDVTERQALYNQIEQMLIDDTPAVFVAHSRAFYVIWKPYVKGFVSTPIGVAQDMNLRIEKSE